MLPELGPGQQRAVTYLWAATQVAATVVRDAFLVIYSSMPDSGGGRTSIKEYCNLAGRSGVHLELLDDGYLSSHLNESPRDAAFLDLKVARIMLEKVLVEKFDHCKVIYGKLLFEVRQLVYLRNDLCHQLLPALPVDLYTTCMQQLETRLCTVTRLAALLTHATKPPEAAIQNIHALFTFLLKPNDQPTHNTDRRILKDSGTQADLHVATLEKGVQVDTMPHHHSGPEVPIEEKVDSLRREAEVGASGYVKNDNECSKALDDSPHPGTPRRHMGFARSGAVTHGIDAAGKRGPHGSQGAYHDAGPGCRLSRDTKKCLLRRSDGTPVKGNKNPATGPNLFPGHNLRRDKPWRNGIMEHDRPRNNAARQEFAALTYAAMTVNHVTYTANKGPCVSSILDVGLSLVLAVMLFLGVLSVATLPLALTILRLTVCGLYYLLVQANRAFRDILWNLCSDVGQRRVMGRAEVVILPHVAPEKVRGSGSVMVCPKDENFGMDFWKSDWKPKYRKKRRKKTIRIVN